MRDRRSALSTRPARAGAPAPAALLVAVLLALPAARSVDAGTYYVGPAGSDASGTGTLTAPWATLRQATNAIPDNGSEIVCLDGSYSGTQVVTRAFNTPVIVRAQTPYRARLVSSLTQHRVLYLSGANVTFQGFEMAGAPGATDSYVIQVTTPACHDVIFQDNVLHDSYRNDILKINDGAHHITVRGNMFYNMPITGDEHMDVNSVHDVVIEDNVFFNDFAGSGRANLNVTHPYVLIKNSGSTFVTRDVIVRRNVFLNWQGASDQPFLLLGEDGQPFHEAEDVLVENNLFLGNSSSPITAAFAMKGAKDITFRANTIVGNLPAGGWAYGIRLGREGANPPNQNIAFYNNIWSDPTGTMQRLATGSPANTINATLRSNLFFNGGQPIPVDASQVLNVGNDPAAVVADPLLPTSQSGLVPPRWVPVSGVFAGGAVSIEAARVELVGRYGTPSAGSPVVGRADLAQMPTDDILGVPRDGDPDLGAVEVRSSSGVDEPAPPTTAGLLSAPNPFRDRTTIELELTETATVEVSVFDLGGRRVRALYAGLLSPGAHLSWDATDDAGARVAAGVYWVRAELGGRQLTQKLIVRH